MGQDMLFKSVLSGMLAEPGKLKKIITSGQDNLIDQDSIEYLKNLPKPKKNLLIDILKFLSNGTDKLLNILTTPIIVISDKIAKPLEDNNILSSDGKPSKKRSKKSRQKRSKKSREKRSKKSREKRSKKLREKRSKKSREKRSKKLREKRSKKSREKRSKKI